MDAIKIILGPIISEKSMSEASKGKYTFKVSNFANKHTIKKAVEDNFKVNVLKITTVNIKGRGKTVGTKRQQIVQSPFKKALVTVKEGQKISIFDQGTDK